MAAERRGLSIVILSSGSIIDIGSLTLLEEHDIYGSIYSIASLQVNGMELEDPAGSSNRVQRIVAALNELDRFHGGEAHIQTTHYSGQIRSHLAHLLRLADINPDMLHNLAAISDFSYAWGLMYSLAPRLQAQVSH